MPISPLSAASLMLTPTANGHALGTATGFVYAHAGKQFLITNWHVVSGRNRVSGQPIHRSAATPDAVAVRYLMDAGRGTASNVMRWTDISEPLLGETGDPLWIEHPVFGRRVDVVALPLTRTGGTTRVPYSTEMTVQTLRAGVSDWVNILGFPFGVAGGGSLAVWTKGGIATELEVDFEDMPCFLIDSRTRPGQSGSPVIAYSPGGATAMADGGTVTASTAMVNLLGVYSGRINEESDLGHVWKATVLRTILENGVQGDNALRPASR
ncbi:trypsin-like peptidase domain-containing protein [Kitasatospora sp. NPDC052896]|uniref:trypsin-like peptidase domain-containing protein n=1 Tax=Kitasatospora sp. NPDC052896 TaxID=3364061 RepID=UPI0037C6B20C